MTGELYENTLSPDELRRELRYFMDRYYGIGEALRNAPTLPPPYVLVFLGQFGKFPDDYNVGKRLQRDHGLEAIPPNTECEIGAGLWARIRRGLCADAGSGNG
jgi:hypothetical protein